MREMQQDISLHTSLKLQGQPDQGWELEKFQQAVQIVCSKEPDLEFQSNSFSLVSDQKRYFALPS